MDASVQELLDLEWQLFDEAPLAGRRTARPGERELFAITHSSELASWTPELRASWRQDLLNAQAEGRNLINEKYIYMLKRTDSERYDTLKHTLPAASMEKLWLVDWICQAQTAWQENLEERYPYLMQSMETVYEDADGPSFHETALRSGLMACSVNTLRLYASQIERSQKAGGNLREDVLRNMAGQLGYPSLETIEAECIESKGARLSSISIR